MTLDEYVMLQGDTRVTCIKCDEETISHLDDNLNAVFECPLCGKQASFDLFHNFFCTKTQVFQ